jgi:hypothetical protein
MVRSFILKRASLTFVTGLIVVWPTVTRAQSAPKDWTAADDHRQMMEQLGIKALRPDPSGNDKDANHANHDESKAILSRSSRRSLLDSRLAWRQHDGGHTDAPNWKHVLTWTDKFFR